MDEEVKQMRLMMRQLINQNGTTVWDFWGFFSSLFGFPSGKGGESEAQPSVGTAVTRLVFPLEAFDVKNTEGGGGGNNSWRDAAPWVDFEGASRRLC